MFIKLKLAILCNDSVKILLKNKQTAEPEPVRFKGILKTSVIAVRLHYLLIAATSFCFKISWEKEKH